MEWTILGNKIKNFRKSNKITQQELADKLEISRSTLSYYELGKIDPNIYTLIKLSDIMNCTLDYLVNDKINRTDTNDFNIDLINTNKSINLLEEIQIYNKKILPILNKLSKIDIDSLNYFLAEFNIDNPNKSDFIKNNISNTNLKENSENVYYDEDFSMYEHKIAEDIDKYIP